MSINTSFSDGINLESTSEIDQPSADLKPPVGVSRSASLGKWMALLFSPATENKRSLGQSLTRHLSFIGQKKSSNQGIEGI